MRVFMTALMVLGTPIGASAEGGGVRPPAAGSPQRPNDSDLQQYGKDKCYEKLTKQCTDEGVKAGANLISGLNGLKGNTMNQQSSAMQGTTAGGAADYSAVRAKCEKIAEQCKTVCDGKKEDKPPKGPDAIKECDAKMKEIASAYSDRSTDLGGAAAQAGATSTASGSTPGDGAKPQSTSKDSGSSGGGGGAGMMGAMAGMAAGMMMAQMMNKKDEDQQQQQAAGVIQADGSLNCSLPEAVNFSGCNDYFAQSCTAAIAAGAFSTSAGCQAFSARYCSAPNASAAQLAQAAQGGLPIVGASGEGLSANPGYCQKVLASNYCAQPGRGGCPSCMSLSAQLGATCTANPALCLAQSSTVSLDMARTTCPTDPMFANPMYAMGGTATVVTGGSGVATTPVSGPVLGGAPVVLPQSVGGASASASSLATASSNANNASLPSDVATREGIARGAASVSGGGGSYGGSSGSLRAQSVRGDRIATSGGSETSAAVAYNATAANVGPAPDVQGQFGPSLFSTSSQAIRSRCESGRLNCR